MIKLRVLVPALILCAGSAQAATLNQIKAAIETFRDDHAAKIVAKQEAYLAAHGTYWQGILTPNALPDDGASVAADWTKKPTDQLERWADVFKDADALPANIPAQIRVDVYDGPLGKGWTITLTGTKNGNRYWKTWAVGPETWRAHDWQVCTLPCTP